VHFLKSFAAVGVSSPNIYCCYRTIRYLNEENVNLNAPLADQATLTKDSSNLREEALPLSLTLFTSELTF
jgi:hypothetical protein